MGCRLLSFGRNVLEFGESFGDIIGHGNVDLTSIVMPIDGKAKVAGASPIDVQWLFFAEGFEEVIRIRFFEIFYSKIVNCKCERSWTTLVSPHTGGVLHGHITKLG